MTLTRITRAEAWLAGGTHLAREKSAHTRGQAVGAFSRGLVLASEWHCPADAVAMRTAKTLAESYGMTSAAALTRVVGHVVLAVIATAEADRTKDAAIAFVDLIHAATGKRALMACSGREPIDAVEDYVIERVTTINVSFVICTVRAAAARNRLVGFTEPFMPAPNSTEYAVIMAPYVEAIKASGRTDAMVQPSTDAFREWLKPRLDDGSYFGWIARLDGTEVAGLGMMVIDWPPHPSHPLQSHRGYILNVFVEPRARSRGLARSLMDMAMEEAKRRNLAYLILHATAMAMPMYEKLGWCRTSEMSMTLPLQP